MNNAYQSDHPGDYEPSLYHLIYMSRASQLLPKQELIELLEQARQRNEQNDVTGMLLYKDLSFIQVLEGSELAVTEIFASINKDRRHSRIRIMLNEPIERRTFNKWRMAFHTIEDSDLSKIAGFSDYFRDSNSISRLIEHPSAVLKLLQHFRVRS